MTNEEKELLLKDLCARLPYGVYIEHTTTGIRDKLTNIVFQHKYNNTYSIQDINAWIMFFGNEYVDATYFRPMLRPMASMTEEEKKDIKHLFLQVWTNDNERLLVVRQNKMAEYLNYLYSHYFDFCGLIPKNLALEAPEGMYNIK